jgi:hypothetical protein
MNKCADSVRVAYPLFQTEGGGSKPTSALQLKFGSIDQKRAISLNLIWHSRLPRFTDAMPREPAVAYGAIYDGIFYATAIWTAPIARLLNGRDWLELRRMAIADDAPANTASRMLGWMARDIQKRFPQIVRLISYQDTEVHTGTIYRAAGWEETMKSVVAGLGWNSDRKSSLATQSYNKMQSVSPKVRWERAI